LPLRNPLRLADFRHSFTSDSNAAFSAVSVKIGLNPDFLLLVYLRIPALRKDLA
jgi:hypothetical protein